MTTLRHLSELTSLYDLKTISSVQLARRKLDSVSARWDQCVLERCGILSTSLGAGKRYLHGPQSSMPMVTYWKLLLSHLPKALDTR